MLVLEFMAIRIGVKIFVLYNYDIIWIESASDIYIVSFISKTLFFTSYFMILSLF